MKLCACGFANSDTQTTCKACGRDLRCDFGGDSDQLSGSSVERDVLCCSDQSPLASLQDNDESIGASSYLVMEDIQSGVRITIPAPGGIIGRAGDFSPDVFSPQVSGVHLVAAYDYEARQWMLEFVGRNATALNIQGSWVALRTGVPCAVHGAELLKMADMVFRLRVDDRGSGVSEQSSSQESESSSARDEMSLRGATGGFHQEKARSLNGQDSAECPSVAEAITWHIRCPVCGADYEVESAEARMDRCEHCADSFDARQISKVTPRAR